MSGQRTLRADSLPIYCRHCGLEIEGCEGEYGRWMHSGTRREHCANVLAEPEKPHELGRRFSKRGVNA